MSPIISGSGSGGTGGSNFLAIDQITAPVNIVGTTVGAPTTVITCAAHTFPGTLVLLTVYVPQLYLGTASGNSANVALWESGAQIALIGNFFEVTASGGAGGAQTFQYSFTPTAASHSYLITAFVASTVGTPVWSASTGGATATSYGPSFALFTKLT